MQEEFCSIDWVRPLAKSVAKPDARLEAALEEVVSRFGDRLDWIPHYVEPRGRYLASNATEATAGRDNAPVLPRLNGFLADRDSSDLSRCLLLLGDSGSGKSSLLTLLRLFERCGYWPSGIDSFLTRCEPGMVDQLARVEKPEQTVLLVDSLDERPFESGELEPFLNGFFDVTRRFKRVILSSNNRFFAKQLGLNVAVAGDVSFGEQDCSLLFLYGFDEASVDEYLTSKYPKGWLSPLNRHFSKAEAERAAKRLGNLRFRPLLLSRIEDLAASEAERLDEYAAYEAMTVQWLLREADENLPLERLFDWVKRIANAGAKSGRRFVSADSIRSLDTDDGLPIDPQRLAAGPSSLLRHARDEQGKEGYAFAHASMLDFVLAQDVLDSSDDEEIVVPSHVSESCVNFIVKGRQRDDEHRHKKLVLRRLKLSEFAFDKADLKNAVMEEVDLRNASFSHADLRGVELKNCQLEGARFDNALATDARFDRLAPGMPYSLRLSDDCSIELLWVEPGSFTLGEGASATPIFVKFGFWLGKYPITQRQYELVVGSNPSCFPDAEPDAPVEQVTWLEAKAFCDRLTTQLNELESDAVVARLPREIEWEHACRAGSSTIFCYGDDESQLGHYAWFASNSAGQPRSVGRKRPNSWGFHDMHGNVWEWCADWSGDFLATSITDLRSAGQREDRVIRGGSWGNQPHSCRSSIRNWHHPTARYNNLGFRLALGRRGASDSAQAKRIGI